MERKKKAQTNSPPQIQKQNEEPQLQQYNYLFNIISMMTLWAIISCQAKFYFCKFSQPIMKYSSEEPPAPQHISDQ